jgi:hypothetical protein
MKRSKLPPFKLAEVSDMRKKFLLRWQLERRLHVQACEAQSDQEQTMVAEPGLTRYGIRPFDTTVSAGDIRLLRMRDVPDEYRFLYVAVLYVRIENGTSVVVPFSPYSVPASKDEWLTGLPNTPLRVLQFWNAQPVATRDLAQSWKTAEFDECRCEQMRRLYKHAIDGSWPQGDLRERVGLAILSPEDERLVYQREEVTLFTQLRTRLFRWGQSADLLAKRRVMFCKAGSFRFTDTGEEFSCPERLAAGSGSVYADVIILSDGGIPMTARAEREAETAHLTVNWHIQGYPNRLLPGQPACLYAHNRKKPLLAQGVTAHDGTRVSFVAKTEREFKAMLPEFGIWIVIQAV